MIHRIIVTLGLLLLVGTGHAQTPSPDLFDLISQRDFAGLEAAIRTRLPQEENPAGVLEN